MMKPRIPYNEQDRVKALQSYQVLDTEAEKAFDDLTILASNICDTPIALISLVDPERQWFKAKVGLTACETERDIAFCAHAIHQSHVFEIPDTWQDERFIDNPLVTGPPYIRFYAGTPLITPEGHAIGTLCVISDQPNKLNDKQRTGLETLGREVISQLELRKKVRELDRVSQFKSDFLSNMSHEIRTPINGITGALHLIQDSPLNAEQSHLVNLALNSAASLSEIVNDILDLSRIEAGKLELQPSPFSLRELMAELGATHNIRASQKHLEFICPTGPIPDVTVNADPLRLRQVLNNLISNAIKFTHEGSIEVGLSVKSSDNQPLTVRFEVQDSGIGLQQHQIEKLFKRYEQAHLTPSYGGTGLGLNICQQLIAMMQGQIGVDSTPGQGSTFWFEIPMEQVTGSADMTLPDMTHISLLAIHSGDAHRRFLERLFSQLNISASVLSEEELNLYPEATDGDDINTGNRPNAFAFSHLLIEDRIEYQSPVRLSERLRQQYPAARDARPILLHNPLFSHPAVDFSLYKGVIRQPLLPSELLNCLSQSQPLSATVDSDNAQLSKQYFDGYALIAEDNKTNQIVAQGLLRKLGLKTCVVENGFEALHQLREERFDIVFMDCRMPAMDGYEATEKLRSDPQLKTDPQVPVIALTANAMQDDEQRCLDAGMSGFLTKPINPKRLTELLAHYLPGKTHQPEAQVQSRAVPAAQASEQPVFDLQSYSDRLGGDCELMQMAIQAALDDFDSLMTSLSTSPSSEQAGLLHQLKGLAANCSALELQEHFRQLEEIHHNGNTDAVHSALPQLNQQLQRFRDIVQQSLTC